MALFNEILVGRLNRWVQKFYGIKSGAPSLTQLIPTVQTVCSIDAGAEDRYLQGWEIFTMAAQQTAVAAQFGAVQLRNPVGSNTLCCIEQVWVTEGGADQMNLSRGFNVTTDLATIVSAPGAVDPRGRSSSGMVGSRTTLVAITDLGNGLMPGAVSGANSPYRWVLYNDEQWPMLPGEAYRVCAQTANQLITVAFRWRERSLESSELT